MTWRRMAACRGMDPEIFHPMRGQSPKPAKAVCGECLVRLVCLADAMADVANLLGVRGGLSYKERVQLRATLNRRGIA